MRPISEKIVVEKIEMHFMITKFLFSKIVPFMR